MHTIKHIIETLMAANELAGNTAKHWLVVFLDEDNVPYAIEASSPLRAVEAFRRTQPTLRVGSVLGMASRKDAEEKAKSLNFIARDLKQYIKWANTHDQMIPAVNAPRPAGPVPAPVSL